MWYPSTTPIIPDHGLYGMMRAVAQNTWHHIGYWFSENSQSKPKLYRKPKVFSNPLSAARTYHRGHAHKL